VSHISLLGTEVQLYWHVALRRRVNCYRHLDAILGPTDVEDGVDTYLNEGG
jgi:hypothetical protein